MEVFALSFLCPVCGAGVTIIGDPCPPKMLLQRYLQRKPICASCQSILNHNLKKLFNNPLA